MKRAILIAGPTASGKSALALRLARDFGGWVVNADSMQVYGDLHVLTARPDEAAEAEVPHRLYGHVDGAVNYSVAAYLADAAALLHAAEGEGRIPILVGGTGLYFKALTQGLSDIPQVPAGIREAIRAEAEGRETPALHAELALRDPATAATLRPSDRQRILRALEVFAATGLPLTAFQARRAPALLADYAVTQLFLSPDREALKRAIDGRFAAMVEAGALDEVARLAGRRLDPALPVMRAHGVPGLMAHLRGEISLDEAIRRGQADTRRYARRQFTWFRHQMPGWIWAAPDEGHEAILQALRR